MFHIFWAVAILLFNLHLINFKPLEQRIENNNPSPFPVLHNSLNSYSNCF